MPKRIIWRGAVYKRGGVIRSKHHTRKLIPATYRDSHSGVVLNAKGRVLGIEQKGRHGWGADYKKRKGLKKPSTFVRPNSPIALKKRGAHIRRLR